MGLLMMSESCYDPHAAISFWDRMQKADQVGIPQFLSTHPSHTNRVTQMQKWLPEAEVKYQGSDCAVTAGWARDFQDRFLFGS